MVPAVRRGAGTGVNFAGGSDDGEPTVGVGRAGGDGGAGLRYARARVEATVATMAAIARECVVRHLPDTDVRAAGAGPGL